MDFIDSGGIPRTILTEPEYDALVDKIAEAIDLWGPSPWVGPDTNQDHEEEMKKPTNKVVLKIRKAEALNEQGRCWCPCVNDDVPKAKELVKAKKFGAANSVITAALKRCHGGLEPDGSFNPKIPGDLPEMPEIQLPEVKT